MRVVDVSQELSHFIVKRYVLWLRDHCHLLHHLRHHLLEGDADDLRLNSLLGSWSWSLSEVVGVTQGTDVWTWSWWRLLPWQGKVDGVGWVGVAQVRAEAQVGVEEWEEELNCSVLNQALHKCTELFLVQPVKSRHQTHTLWPGAGCSAQHFIFLFRLFQYINWKEMLMTSIPEKLSAGPAWSVARVSSSTAVVRTTNNFHYPEIFCKMKIIFFLIFIFQVFWSVSVVLCLCLIEVENLYSPHYNIHGHVVVGQNINITSLLSLEQDVKHVQYSPQLTFLSFASDFRRPRSSRVVRM